MSSDFHCVAEKVARQRSKAIYYKGVYCILTNLVRRGNDLVLVAEVEGNRRLETTRRYSLLSLEDRECAMEGLGVDY
jgi:hypothetical protein